MPGSIFHRLQNFWITRQYRDEYIGTLVNAYLQEGGTAVGVKAGSAYVDVGTIDGYRAAIHLLKETSADQTHRWAAARSGLGSASSRSAVLHAGATEVQPQ
jgi:hypothetical protein